VAREALGNPIAGDDAHAAWVAPEVLRGEDAHPRSAVYSFGAIAYTLLTGGPPHVGTPQEIASSRPPRLSHARPDLPATLDTIFAVAMAPDPRKRYATAAEARHLLNLVIYGAPSMPALEASPRFRRGSSHAKRSSSRTKEAPVRPAPRLQPAAGPHPRRAPVLVGLLLASALAAGGAAGTLAAGGESAPAAHPQATAAGMTVDLPEGWQQRPAEAGRLEAQPRRDAVSGLTVAISDKALRGADGGTPVVLGDYEAWRHEATPTKGGRRTARYVIPTSTGSVEISCAAAPGSPSNTLPLCERTASTLRLGSERRALALSAVVEAQQRWRLAASRLRIDRAEGRRTLSQAGRQAAQIQAAQGLARIHERAATRFAGLSDGEAVAKTARETAAAYRALARAASRNSASGWADARAAVRSAEARLAKAVAAG
jgi:hypothetical protein